MKGWTLDGQNDAVAVVVSPKCADLETVSEVLQAAPSDTVFVIRARDVHAEAALTALGIEYVEAGLNPFWKWKTEDGWGDRRRVVREEQLLMGCRRVLVFTTPDTTTLDQFIKADPKLYDGKVRIVSSGKQPVKKHRKGRTIV